MGAKLENLNVFGTQHLWSERPTKVTADKIRQTASSKGTGSDAASNAKNVKHTGKRKFSVGNESLKKKAKSGTSAHPSSTNIPDKSKSKQSTPKMEINPTLLAEKLRHLSQVMLS